MQRLSGPVQVITFDAGGTLLYPYPSVGAVYAEVMTAHGLEVGAEVVNAAFDRVWERALRDIRHEVGDEKAWWRETVRQTVVELEHGLPDHRFDPLFEELWDTFADPRRWRLFEAALDTLAELRLRGYRLAILSNWDPRLRGLLEKMGISDHVEHQVISGEIGAEKPDVRIFRHVERCFGLGPEAFLHIGDSEHHDQRGAHAAGWQVLLIRHGQPPRDGSLTSLPQLLDVLPKRPAE